MLGMLPYMHVSNIPNMSSGYGCLDHFLEGVWPSSFVCCNYRCVFIGDTTLHSWEIMGRLLESDDTKGVLCDIGM